MAAPRAIGQDRPARVVRSALSVRVSATTQPATTGKTAATKPATGKTAATTRETTARTAATTVKPTPKADTPAAKPGLMPGVNAVRRVAPRPPKPATAEKPAEKKTEGGIHIKTSRRAGFNWYTTDGAGMRWDISSNGQVSDGTNDAYDGGMQLRVSGSSFSASSSSAKMSKDGHEIEIGPWTRGSVRVWRRIYIDKAGGYARWIDIFENTSKSATSLPVEYYTNLGGSIRITTTTSDKPDLTGKDWGIVTADSTNSSRPAILHIFANRGSQMKPTVRFNRNSDDFRVNYKLKIPAGRKVAICQFEAQRPGNSAAVALMKSFKPRRELDKIPADLRRIIANMGGASLVMGDIDLPRREDHDLAVLRKGDEWLGTILNENYRIETLFGTIDIPAEKVVGLSVPAADNNYVQAVLLDGQLVAGKLLDGPIRMKLANGNEMSLPPDKLQAASYALSPKRPEQIRITRPTVVLRSGQQLAFRESDLDMHYQTLYGNVDLDADDLSKIEFDTPDGGLHRAVFRNGTVISGLLLTESLKLHLDLGPLLETRRQAVAQIIFPGEETEGISKLCDMSLRNDDELFGRIADESLVVDTQFGKVKVQPSEIDELTVPDESPLGQVSIKLHNGTTVTGKFVGQSIAFQVEPGPAMSVFLGNIVQIKCPSKGGSSTASRSGSGTSSRPPANPLTMSSADFRERTIAEAKARQARAAAEKAKAAAEKAAKEKAAAKAADEKTEAKAKADDDKAKAEQAVEKKAATTSKLQAQLKQLSADLKDIDAMQEKLAATAKELAKKGNDKETAKRLELLAKQQADLAKKSEAVRKQIADVQKALLEASATSKER